MPIAPETPTGPVCLEVDTLIFVIFFVLLENIFAFRYNILPFNFTQKYFSLNCVSCYQKAVALLPPQFFRLFVWTERYLSFFQSLVRFDFFFHLSPSFSRFLDSFCWSAPIFSSSRPLTVPPSGTATFQLPRLPPPPLSVRRKNRTSGLLALTISAWYCTATASR